MKWATVASSTRYGKAYFFSNRSFIKKLQWFTKETLSSSFQSIWQRRRGCKRNNNKKSLLLYEISLNQQLIDSINHTQSKESKQLIMNTDLEALWESQQYQPILSPFQWVIYTNINNFMKKFKIRTSMRVIHVC